MKHNGRSNHHFISTRSQRQRELWLDLFGLETLPVISPYPHEAMDTSGRVLVFYTLDTSRMTPMQINRLASHVGGMWGSGYVRALDRILLDGWNIDATYCELLETAELKRPSLSIWSRFRKLAPSFVGVGGVF